MRSAAIYARVSTDEQDVSRQLEECREHIARQFPAIEDSAIDVFADVVSGASETGGEQYRELWSAIETDDYDLVVVHELSRLSRLGAGEIHRFIQHCLEHETAIESLDIGLSIHVDDPRLQQTVYTMIANIMGDLAKIEHQQKLGRIQSGIRAAQQAGTWTGRPPRGFTIGEAKHLHVSPGEFLETRAALERIAQGGANTRSRVTPASLAAHSSDSTRTSSGDGCASLARGSRMTASMLPSKNSARSQTRTSALTRGRMLPLNESEQSSARNST